MTGLGLALEAVVDQLYDGIYVVDIDRVVTYWSKGAERMLGYSADEVVGRRCSDGLLLHVDAQGVRVCGPYCPLSVAMLTGEPQCAEYFALHRNGHRVPVRIRIAPLTDERGDVVGAIEAFTDNTAHVQDKERIDELEQSALIDHLTGLPNRRHIDAHLESALAEADRYGTRFGVLLFDIDHFKAINDQHGHQAGDEVLKTVSRTLGASARAGDMVGRWGGEEFLLVARTVGRDGLARAGERFRVLVESSVCRHAGAEFRVTASVGAAMHKPGDTADSLIARADRALYRAKETGRNRVVVDDDPPVGRTIPLEAVAPAARVATTEV